MMKPIRQPTLFDLNRSDNATAARPLEVTGTQILLGTSSFTASGWEGSFYPKGMKSTSFLSYYAKQFRTVEIDSTFYGTPSAKTVASAPFMLPPSPLTASLPRRVHTPAAYPVLSETRRPVVVTWVAAQSSKRFLFSGQANQAHEAH